MLSEKSTHTCVDVYGRWDVNKAISIWWQRYYEAIYNTTVCNGLVYYISITWKTLFRFQGKYSTRSDVWSFGVTLWEMLCYCRHSPYHALTNQDVITNLQHLSVDEEADFFEFLEKPPNCPRDIYQLICDTWCRNDEDRPTFWEIHCFLSRKNITFCTEMINREIPAYIEAHTHAQQYIV